MMEGVAIRACVVVEAAIMEAAMAKALLMEVPALASKGSLRLASTQLVLPSPALRLAMCSCMSRRCSFSWSRHASLAYMMASISSSESWC
jgi:hypothetical protein